MISDPLERFLRDLERLHQACRMYPAGHQSIAGAAEVAARALADWGRPVRMSLLGEDLVVEDRSVHDLGGRLKALATLLRNNGWEGVRISPACAPTDLLEWIGRAQSELQGPYTGGGIVAGPLALERGREPAVARDGWSGEYSGYVPDAREALEQLDRTDPEGLNLARRIVRSLTAHLAAEEGLLKSVRQLKDFDEYTYTHALNVSILSMALARRLALPSALAEAIALGGLCHDLGKAKVPAGILNKPGRLDPEEWQIMKRHPAAGAEILLSMPGGVDPLLPAIAFQHHVGQDASGYPRLRLDPSPHPVSLLVQVADIYDALRTIRPYRTPLSEVQAVNILIGDMNGGKLHKGAVSALVGVLDLLAPGTPVRLTDGRCALVVAASGESALTPLVETDEGDILDLCDQALPAVAELVDRVGGGATDGRRP